MNKFNREYLSDQGIKFVLKLKEYLINRDIDQLDKYIKLIQTSKNEIFSDGLRAIYEPDFESPSICALLLFGKSGLDMLYRLMIDDNQKISSYDPIQILNSVAWRRPEYVLRNIDFFQDYFELAIVQNISSVIKAIYNDPVLSAYAQSLLERAIRYSISEPSSRFLLTLLISSAEGEIFDFVVSVVAKNSLNVSEGICSNFEELIHQDLEEQVYQKFLQEHPALLDPLASSIVDRQYLGEMWKTDFVIRRLDNEYIFVEIEKPQDRPLTNYPHPSVVLSHAIGQVLNWFIWVEDNISYAQTHGFPGIHLPHGIIVIGRNKDLEPSQRRMLQAINDAFHPRLVIYTYDDLMVNAKNILQNLTSR